MVKVEGQGRCMLDAGGYIFNTEAHPIDPAALACCSGLSEAEVISAMHLILYYFLSLIHHPTRELNLILMFIAE